MKRFFMFSFSMIIITVVLLSCIPVASAVSDLTLFDTYSVSVSSGDTVMYKFVPKVTGNYVINSSIGSGDPYVTFYDGSHNYLNSNDDSNGSRNFSLNCYMAANATYYFEFRCYNYNSGSYSVKLDLVDFEGTSGVFRGYVDSTYTPRTYDFTPSETGVYRFYSTSESQDTKLYIYSSENYVEGGNNTAIGYDDDSGPGYNFSETIRMIAGKKYKIMPTFYSNSNTGAYDIQFNKLAVDRLDVSTSNVYYVGDSAMAGIIGVTAYYYSPTSEFNDEFSFSLNRKEYEAYIDTSEPGTKELSVVFDGYTFTKNINVKTPSVFIKDEKGVNYYNEEDTCFVNTLYPTFTAVTDPNVVTVKWITENPDIIKIDNIDGKNATFNVINPGDAVLTAVYEYNGFEYKQSFNINIGLIVKDVNILESKTTYACGSKFKREKVEITYIDVINKTELSQTISMYGDLPSTNTIGLYTRVIKFGDVSKKYSYKVVCTKPEITSVKTSSSSTQVIEWSKSTGAKGYYVYRATSKDGKYTKIGSTTSTSFTSTDLKPFTTYYYKVRGYYSTANNAYDSSYSVPEGKKTKLAKPKITAVTAKSTTKQTITWDKVSGAKGYYVYRATSKDGKYSKIGSTTKTSFSSTGLKANKVYYYKVKAYYYADDSVYDSSYSTAVSGRTKLSTPTGVKAKGGSKKVTISWKAVSGAKKYSVYRATSKSGTYKKIASVTTTKYTNTGLSSKKTYYYKVRAISKTKGSDSATSSIVSAKTK